MVGTGDHNAKGSKTDWERQILNVVSNTQNLDLKQKRKAMSIKEGPFGERVGEGSRQKERVKAAVRDWSTLHACMKIE
jgi:hypothetical protein